MYRAQTIIMSLESFRNPKIICVIWAETNVGRRYFLEYSAAKTTFLDLALEDPKPSG